MDWRDLLELIPVGVGLAKRDPGGAAFMHGWSRETSKLKEERLREQESQRREQALEAEMRNRSDDNRRMEQQARLQRLSLALQQFQPAMEQQIETATDPTGAAQMLGNQSRQLEQSFELQPGAMRPFVPSAQVMAPLISQAKIRRAKAKYGEFLKLYGDRAAESEDAQTIRGGEFDGLTFRQVRELSETVRPPEREATPPNKQLQSKEVMKDGRRVIVNFDPDTGEYQEAQGVAPIPPASAQAAPGGLPPRIQSRVDQTARGFDTQPIVRNIQKMAEAVQFTLGLDPNQPSPSDDQALIYAFAKAMDPDSVVREGEYATVQKYAQSWAETFGFNVARVFSNTPFLSAQARQNMKSTIQKKYAASKIQYDNLRKSYGQRIDKITGEAGTGESWLLDYAGGFPDIEAPSGPSGNKPAQVGEERMINGVPARWDGKGWVKL